MTKRTWAGLALAVLAASQISCSRPEEPTPVVVAPSPTPPTCSIVVNGDNNNVLGTCGGTVITQPSPSPSGGPFVRPDYVKITQFGESCPDGIAPSGQDRSVRIGCTKALTLSPKCRQANGLPDIDCPVPENAAPDVFEVKSGGEHIQFSKFGSASLSAQALSAFSGPHMASDAFNRLAKGLSAGDVTITGAYAGVKAQDDFVLKVIP